MPKGKDQYQALEGHEKLTWTDKLRAGMHSDLLRTNEDTGAVENPRREFLRERIKVRQEEAARDQREAERRMKEKLRDSE